jgi:hypothetical protein
MQYAVIGCICSRVSTVEEVDYVSSKEKKAAGFLEEGKRCHDPHSSAG